MSLNPKLKELRAICERRWRQDKAWVKSKASRHLLMDARGWEVCGYMWAPCQRLPKSHRA